MTAGHILNRRGPPPVAIAAQPPKLTPQQVKAAAGEAVKRAIERTRR